MEAFDILDIGLLFFSWKEIEFVWFTCVIVLSIDKLWIFKNCLGLGEKGALYF